MPPDYSQSEVAAITTRQERQLLRSERHAEGFDIVGIFLRRKSRQVYPTALHGAGALAHPLTNKASKQPWIAGPIKRQPRFVPAHHVARFGRPRATLI